MRLRLFGAEFSRPCETATQRLGRATIWRLCGTTMAVAFLAYGGTAQAGTAQAGTAQQINTLSQAERDAGWSLLFDGESLDGWRGYNRPDARPGRGTALCRSSRRAATSVGVSDGAQAMPHVRPRVSRTPGALPQLWRRQRPARSRWEHRPHWKALIGRGAVPHGVGAGCVVRDLPDRD